MIGQGMETWDNGLLWAVVMLFLLLIILAGVQYDLTHHTVRIYNWETLPVSGQGETAKEK